MSDRLNLCKTKIGVLNNAYLSGITWDHSSHVDNPRDWKSFHTYIARTLDPTHKTWKIPHPLLLSAKATSEDNPNWHQAVNGPFAEQFQVAMETEIETLEKLGAWVKVNGQVQ